MECLASVVVIAGFAALVIGAIWLIVLAFQQGIGWGLAVLFIPLVSLVFGVLYWSITRTAMLCHIAGIVLVLLGLALGGPSLETSSP